MLLVRLARDHRACLRADFRQYYGVSFDRMERTSPVEAADLAAMLPRGSRTFSAIEPEFYWTQADYMMASIEYSLRWLVWAQTRDGQRNRNRPRPLEPPKRPARRRGGLTADEMEEILSRPRKEVV